MDNNLKGAKLSDANLKGADLFRAMRTILILLVLVLAGCIHGLPAIQRPQTTQRIFDKHGRYEGRIDSRDRIFDEHGRYEGHIDGRGREFDQHGKFKGRIEKR